MKYLILPFLLTFTISGFAQKNFIKDGKLNDILPLDPSGNVHYQNVKDLQGVSKDELYKRARKWFVKSYNSPKDVLQLSDASTGELTGRGIFEIKPKIVRVWLPLKIDHTISVELKDNKYRITLNNVKVNNADNVKDYKMPYIATTENQYTALYTGIDQKCKELIASLEKALTTADDF